MRETDPLQLLAIGVWGALSGDEAATLRTLSLQVGMAEMHARLGSLAYGVARGRIDPPSAAVWLQRQRPRHGQDP